MHTDPDPVLVRLSHLERACRNSRRLAAAACLGLASVPLLAFLAPQDKAAAPDVVRATAFELVDGEGAVRARLGLAKDGGSELRLFNAAGKVRARFGLHKDSDPLLTLVDEEDHNRVSLIYDSNPHFVLAQKGGKPIVHITAGETGAASLLFTHKDGRHNAGLGIHTNGDGFLIQRKSEGN